MDKTDKRLKFVKEVRSLYESRMSYKITPSRHRDNVEHRAAVSNGVKPFAPVITIGKAMGMDHSTIVHYTKQHESYFKWSPEYRMYFSTALHCAAEVAHAVGQEPMSATYLTARTQMQNLNEIIRWAEEIKERLLHSLERREQEMYIRNERLQKFKELRELM
jgi:hypothetical protein